MMFGMGSIGSYGGIGWFPDYAQMNDLKLIAQFSKNNNAISPVGALGAKRSSQLSTGQADFIKNYQSKMTSLLTDANSLRGDVRGSGTALSVQSQDSTKVTAQAKYRLDMPASYKVNVHQLAQEQVNFADGFNPAGNDAMRGQLNIAVAGRDNPITINVDSISGRNNREKLQNIAKEINGFHAGVSAMVMENEGQSVLALYGDKAGTNSAFQVSGSFAETTGLDQAEQAAADAVYTVDKGDAYGPQTYTSQSNDVHIGGYQIEATLKGTGETTLRVGRDPGKMADALGKLVDSFNAVRSYLSDNASRGVGVQRQLDRMAGSPISKKSLEYIGITTKKDGSLSLDKEAFQLAYARNPSLVEGIVSGSAGIANSIANDAQRGLNVSSASLVSQNPAGSRYSGASYLQAQNAKAKDPLNIFSAYSRYDINNFLNYNSVGLLMNINI